MLFFCTIFSLTIYGKQNTIIKKGKALKIETINSFKNWLGIETIYENGIIENNKKEYIDNFSRNTLWSFWNNKN
mgnify:FL=1